MWTSYTEAVRLAQTWILEWLIPGLVLLGAASVLVRAVVGWRRLANGRCERCGQPRPATEAEEAHRPCVECGAALPSRVHPLSPSALSAATAALAMGSPRLRAKLVIGLLGVTSILGVLWARTRIDISTRYRLTLIAVALASLWMLYRAVAPGVFLPRVLRASPSTRWPRLRRALCAVLALLLAAPLAILLHRAVSPPPPLVVERDRAAGLLLGVVDSSPQTGILKGPIEACCDSILFQVWRSRAPRHDDRTLMLWPQRWTTLDPGALALVTDFDTFFAPPPTPSEIRQLSALRGLRQIHFWRLSDSPETRAALADLSRTHLVTGIVRDLTDAPLERVEYRDGVEVRATDEVATPTPSAAIP